jgi:hypothetical protein
VCRPQLSTPAVTTYSKIMLSRNHDPPRVQLWLDPGGGCPMLERPKKRGRPSKAEVAARSTAKSVYGALTHALSPNVEPGQHQSTSKVSRCCCTHCSTALLLLLGAHAHAFISSPTCTVLLSPSTCSCCSSIKAASGPAYLVIACMLFMCLGAALSNANIACS